ncbi:DUF1566 domain-containing protein [candidate division KSB1 bacterium]|nr:DUF1566 domain-containing protein [candidate division KSB1 bacterium]
MRYYFLFNLFGLPLAKEPLTIIVLIGLLATILKIIADITGLWQKWTANWKDFRDKCRLRQRPGAELYTPEDIIKHRKYYIQPQCQDVDPSQEVDIRKVHAVTSDLFEYVDKLLTQPDVHKYSIILADSGMGKTSFVVNYWYRYWRDKKRRAQYNLAMVPLGQGKKKVDAFIGNLPEKHNTVLFLDAFDEDSQAIEDHQKRLTELLELATDFKQIFITCRTQFFRFQEEIPSKTGVLVIGSKDLKSPGSYEFKKLYLTPFSDEQVKAYLKRYFGRWQRKKREQARQLVDKIPSLTVRPMILTYIPDLVESNKNFKYPFQLYEEIVQKWLEREKPFIPDTEILQKFSECLAIDLYAQKSARGGERVHYRDLLPLARRLEFPLKDWQIRGRSLLNRDVEGNYKFAHRSIMEFLFVKRFLAMPAKDRPRLKWTDQMHQFLEEMLQDYELRKEKFPDLSRVDLTPFTDDQIEYFFRRRFPAWLQKELKKALDRVYQMLRWSNRELTLTYLEVLIDPKKHFNYTFQIYETIISHWLELEKGFVKDSQALRQFSEHLALKLVSKKDVPEREQIDFAELKPLAGQFNILLQDWKLQTYSLLNQTENGNYQFIHSSIMEYLLVKRFLALPAMDHPRLKWTDQMLQFLAEILQGYQDQNQRLPELKNILTQLTNEQIEYFFERRFPSWPQKELKKALDRVHQMSLWSNRELMLNYLGVLIDPDKHYKYSFQINEAIIDHWLELEKEFVKDSQTLRQFSEHLALDLVLKKDVPEPGKIGFEDLKLLAERFNISLQDWKLQTYSLLNQTENGNYQFVHPSIMESLFVKRFLALPAKDRSRLKWTDQMFQFLGEILSDCNEKKHSLPDLSGIDLQRYHFRDNFATLTIEQVKSMLQKYNLFDSDYHKTGNGIKHRYFMTGEKDKVILDLTTGLIWQQGGSPEYFYWKDVQKWIDDLNRKGYAGYHDWRLPTLEEAMSLMEPKKLNSGLYIDPVFDKSQRWIWTADQVAGGSLRWVVYFASGNCHDSSIYDYLRLVRSGLSSTGE